MSDPLEQLRRKAEEERQRDAEQQQRAAAFRLFEDADAEVRYCGDTLPGRMTNREWAEHIANYLTVVLAMPDCRERWDALQPTPDNAARTFALGVYRLCAAGNIDAAARQLDEGESLGPGWTRAAITGQLKQSLPDAIGFPRERPSAPEDDKRAAAERCVALSDLVVGDVAAVQACQKWLQTIDRHARQLGAAMRPVLYADTSSPSARACLLSGAECSATTLRKSLEQWDHHAAAFAASVSGRISPLVKDAAMSCIEMAVVCGSGTLPAADLISAWIQRVQAPSHELNILNELMTRHLCAIGAERLAVTEEADINPPACEQADSTAKSNRRKRSSQRSDAETKIIAALTLHHQYADGGCLNLNPIGNNALGRSAGVSSSTASEFFKDEFGGYSSYCGLCGRPSDLVVALKLLNGEFAPRILFGNRPPENVEHDDTAE